MRPGQGDQFGTAFQALQGLKVIRLAGCGDFALQVVSELLKRLPRVLRKKAMLETKEATRSVLAGDRLDFVFFFPPWKMHTGLVGQRDLLYGRVYLHDSRSHHPAYRGTAPRLAQAKIADQDLCRWQRAFAVSAVVW